jgi:isopenicillin-N N-acyltransferase-like protein
MANKGAAPLIRVKGDHKAIGQQVGEACAPSIKRMLETYRKTLKASYEQIKLTWDEAVLQSNKYTPYVYEHMPRYASELEGMAQGANVEFSDLMVLNCIEAITSDALHLGCTSVAVSSELTRDGHVLVGHNEDWLPDDEDNVYLIHATPDNEPAFLAATYGGLLPNIGFNTRGIAQCCDTVYPRDARVGIPRLFISRGVLGAQILAGAIRAAIHKWRAAGYNHLIVDEHGEMYNIEVSAQHFATIYGLDGYLAHTNNYQTKRMKQIEKGTEDLIGARVRSNRATRLLKRQDKHDLESLHMLLSDHVNHPNSICSHTDPSLDPLDQQKTIGSLIMDLTAKEMHFCWGSPCTGTYHTYSL